MNSTIQSLLERHNSGEFDLSTLLDHVYVAGMRNESLKMSEDDNKKFAEWAKEQDQKIARKQGKKNPYYGAIGGAYTWIHGYTTLGATLQVRNDLTGEMLDFEWWRYW